MNYNDIQITWIEGNPKEGEYHDACFASLHLSCSFMVDKESREHPGTKEKVEKRVRHGVFESLYKEVQDLAREAFLDLRKVGYVAYGQHEELKPVLDKLSTLIHYGENLYKTPTSDGPPGAARTYQKG